MNVLSQPAWVVEHGDGVVLAIMVQPRASKNQLCGVQGQELKVRLTSPPVDGAANKLCREYFAKLLGCSKSRVSLQRGHKSRHKRLLVEGLSCAEVLQVLNGLLV
ncbi:MAG: DUF167 domain-containing protein [Thermodesulfobacteriota bacterium]|nr:DUF167 domain-containing protein [Thermodesulfobacteriota bacterium]